MLVNAALNAGADAVAALVSHLAIHSGFPGTAGANEITTAPATRQAIAWNAAGTGNPGEADLNGTAVFTVPAGETVQFIGFWSAGTAGTFYGYAAAGGSAPFFVVGDATADTLIAQGHGLANDERVVFMGGSPPGGLTEGTIYWVINVTTDTFQVSATQGGAAIDLTTSGDKNLACSKIVPETFGAQASYTVSELIIGATS